MAQRSKFCPVPGCDRRVIPGRAPHGLCPHCEQLLNFLLFVLPHIEASQGTPNALGLILPGQQGFTMPEIGR